MSVAWVLNPEIMNTIILISVLLLAPSAVAITPRRRARVDVPKASKIKKELAASTKKQAAAEDVGFAHRYFSTAIDDSRFFFRALAVRGGEEKPLVTPEKVLSYGGALCGNQPVRRLRVDGVDVDATIQHEGAVKF